MYSPDTIIYVFQVNFDGSHLEVCHIGNFLNTDHMSIAVSHTWDVSKQTHATQGGSWGYINFIIVNLLGYCVKYVIFCYFWRPFCI